MKAILQRVSSASVTVDRQLVSSIQRGVLVFAAVAPDDTSKEVARMAEKIVKMKLWPDEAGNGNWKQNVADIKGEILCVSQFTLLASTKKGNKPDFHGAAGEQHARTLYEAFVAQVRAQYDTTKVKEGVFQAMQDVALVNDGPTTLELEVTPIVRQSKKTFTPASTAASGSAANSGVATPQSESSAPGTG